MICQETEWRDPIEAFSGFRNDPYSMLLHPSGKAPSAQWSVIAAEPTDVIEANAGVAKDSFFDSLRNVHATRALKSGRPKQVHHTIPFCTGLLGFVGYEMAEALEPAVTLPPSPYELPDAAFGVYDATACFDRLNERAYVIGRTESSVAKLLKRLNQGPRRAQALPSFTQADSNFSPDNYRYAVHDIIERIRAGDLFQANLSQCLHLRADAPIPSHTMFRELIRHSTSQFGALLIFDRADIVSISPERFFAVSAVANELRIICDPVKGTRKRSQDPVLDEILASDLENDPKERAENVMIADLIRNDLSRVCRDHSISEDFICRRLTLPAVHHLVSRISGTLRPECNGVDALTALFPCGSITGAPKVESMKVIGGLEPHGRGPYCGAIGYFDDRGSSEFSVAIRTAIVSKRKKQVTVPVGGGVTLMSDPDAEYEETLDKARYALDHLQTREKVYADCVN